MKLLGDVQVKNGILLLDDSKIAVLGGEVDHMIEKWEFQRVRCMFLLKRYYECIQIICSLFFLASVK